MKKLLLLFCIVVVISASVSPFAVQASAQAEGTGSNETYACILLPNTYLYQAEDVSSGLFVLPQTYYVKVLQEGVNFCYVEYAAETESYHAVRGYCLTSELYFVDFQPERPFVNYTFELTFVLDGFSENMVSGFLDKIDRTCSYYGDFSVGSSVYCYVYMDGMYGYVPRPADLEYPLNYDYLPPEELPPDQDGSAGGFLTEETLNAIKVVSVAVLSVLGVLAIYLAIRLNARQKPAKPARDWYEES